MIRHTVLMPFARLRFATILRDHMRGQKVEWRPLCDKHALVPLDGPPRENDEVVGSESRIGWSWNDGNFFADPKDAEWIKPWHCPSKPEGNIGHWLCDRFLDAQQEADKEPHRVGGDTPLFFAKDHYVSFMTDDFLWDTDHWLSIRRRFDSGNMTNPERGWQGAQQLKMPESPKVIICAYQVPRGPVQPASYPHDMIRDAKDPVQEFECWKFNTCRPFVTMFEVLTVRADLLREERFGPVWCADGFMVQRLCKKHSMTPANDTLVYPNGLRPEVYGFPASHQR